MGKERSSALMILGVTTLSGLILLAGCQSERLAKEIAKVRKSGHVQEARDRSLEELQKSPDELSLWRELAATDLALCERPSSSDITEMYPYLVQSALLCTAVYESGKMDKKWQSVASRTAVMTGALANQILNDVVVITTRGRTHLKAEPLTPVELESERYVDTEEMEWTVQHAVPLIFFTRHLGPVLSKELVQNVDNLENRLAQMAENTNISEAMLNDRRTVAMENISGILDAAEQNLTDQGYFDYETIISKTVVQ